VANIPREATQKDLERVFGAAGTVTCIEFKGDFAFVEYEKPNCGEDALRRFDGYELHGKRLLVEPYCYRGGDERYHNDPKFVNLRATPNPNHMRNNRGGNNFGNNNQGFGNRRNSFNQNNNYQRNQRGGGGGRGGNYQQNNYSNQRGGGVGGMNNR